MQTTNGRLLWIGLAVASIFSIASEKPASAAESGTSPYLQGYKDFLSGIVPPDPGVYMRDDTIYYNGSIDRTTIGGRVDANLNQWFVTNIISPTVVTSYHVLGGAYAYGILVPIIEMNVNAQVGTAGGRFSRSDSDEAFNIGDIYLTPVILGWNDGNFHWNVAFSVVTPTGHYNKDALANTGLNYWSFMPQLGFTYLAPKTGQELSVSFVDTINTENHATDYLTGNIFDMDWAVGQELSPALKIGVTGYLLEQVTGDRGPGAILGSNEASVWALGPAVTYSFVAGSLPLALLAKWTHQISATHTFQGDTVTASVSFKF